MKLCRLLGRHAGKYIPSDYVRGEECFSPLVIYVYDIENLDPALICNIHESEIIIEVNGKWGIETLSSTNDDDYLLVSAYKCASYFRSHVYQVSLTDGLYTTTVFTQASWGFGFDVKENGKIYFCEDNRYREVFYVIEYVKGAERRGGKVVRY